MPDPYADGTAQSYWLATDIGYLASRGFDVAGVDISEEAIRQAQRRHPGIRVEVADVRCLPYRDASVDYLLDRGCFHYLPRSDRRRYAFEAWRVLRPGGELLLRACLHAQGVRNDITEVTIREIFDHWRIEHLETRWLPTDTRFIEAIYARLRRP